jgi:PIN domain nuclease of toxin-antitoxin system
VKLLLDTHVLIRWMAEPKKLSKDQFRALEETVRLRQPVAISAITLIEIALLFTDGSLRIKTATAAGLFDELSANPTFQILPLSFEIAEEVLNIGRALRDPADCTIAATARVHGLRLLTSEQRIIESNLVQTID